MVCMLAVVFEPDVAAGAAQSVAKVQRGALGL